MKPTQEQRLAGKCAVVTGTAGGLGKAIAQRFAGEGASVLCVDRRKLPNQEVVEAIRASGGNAFAACADVGEAADVARVGETVDQTLGGLDVLVNNAGIIPSRETVLETPVEDWDESFRVNVKSMFLMSRMAIPRMTTRGGGSIINMSSITGLVGLPVRPAYCASKGAVSLLTRQMAVDFGPRQIRVNALNPSFVITDLNRPMFDQMKAEGAPWDQMLAQHPLGRLGDPEDVAAAALFLASDESSWMTGVLLPVDGGYTAR